MTYEYPDHPVIRAIDKLHWAYDSRADDSVYRITVYYRDGRSVCWQSRYVTGFAEPVPDAAGERIYACSLRWGLACLEAATGAILWRKRRWAMKIVENPDGTLSCRYVGKVFVMTPEGAVCKEIKNISSNLIRYAGEHLWFLYFRGRYCLVSTETLEILYSLPRAAIAGPEDIRFVTKIGDCLRVEYFSAHPGDGPGEVVTIPLV